MYHDTAQRDYIRSELEYRLARVQDGIAGRRRRRRLARHRRGPTDTGNSRWTLVR